jgi:hypothetical protein
LFELIALVYRLNGEPAGCRELRQRLLGLLARKKEDQDKHDNDKGKEPKSDKRTRIS